MSNCNHSKGEFTLHLLDVRLWRNMQDCQTSTNFVCQQKRREVQNCHATILTLHVRLLKSYVRIPKWCKNRQEFLQCSKYVGPTSFFLLGNSYLLMQEFSFANVEFLPEKFASGTLFYWQSRWIYTAHKWTSDYSRIPTLTNSVCQQNKAPNSNFWCRNSYISKWEFLHQIIGIPKWKEGWRSNIFAIL